MIYQLKIKTLVIGAVTLLVSLMILIGATGLYGAKHSVDLITGVTLVDQQNRSAQNAIRLDMELNRSQVLQALQHNPGFGWSELHDHALDVHFDQIATVTARAQKRWAAYLASVQSPEEKRLAADWYVKSEGLGLGSVTAAAAAIKAGRWDDAEMVLIKKINPTYRSGDVSLKALTDASDARVKERDAGVASGLERTTYGAAAVLAIGVVLGMVVAWLLVRAIDAPLRKAMMIATKVAEGDLTGEIEVHSNNEFGELLKALGKMRANLAAIVAEVRTSTDTIAGASREIAAGNMDLSERTSDQAGSLEQTASSMEELTSTVKQNSDNAEQANKLALSASAVASRGGIVVEEVVATMGSINDSSKKIVDIIAVIDSIAFQTNILALNAAVEAARAGEQGRGFAVVASEVRNLAQRSASAAKEIKQLIGDSVTKVDAGAKLVDHAGATMREIVSSIQKVTDIMGEITLATHEQNAGLGQINVAITQMDTITQQNVALVEEAAGAATSLQDQAQVLAKVVSVFKLLGPLSSSTKKVTATLDALAKTSEIRRGPKPATAKLLPKPAARRNAGTKLASGTLPEGEWESF